MSRRILLIGMDAAAPDLLLRGCRDGSLPVLARLQAAGAWGLVEALPGFGSGATWPSFYTGVTPARHGRYFYRQVWRGEYEARRFEAYDFKAPAIWDLVSAAGRRVAIFDVPKAALSPDVNGLHAVDWLVHGAVYHQLTTAPASLADELEERFGLDPLPQCDRPGGRTPAEHREMIDCLIRRIETKEQGTLHYLKQEPWDLFVTVFGEPHCVGHQCWHLRDPSHPAYDPAVAGLVGDPVMDVYRAIDASLGRILDEVGDDVVVLVVSVTGMRPNFTGNFVLDEVLRRLEGQRRTLGYDLLGRAKRVAKRLLPREMRRRYRPRSRQVEERAAHADRARRRCFAVPHNDIAGAIRVNLKGREPEGRVDPTEVGALHEWLRSELKALRNLETGAPVVEEVVFTADFCAGEQLADLPDFFVLWHRAGPIDRVGSERVGEVVYRHRGNRTGDHAPESIFFATGPGIESGRVDGSTLMDFAPTIAALLGVPWQGGDGHAIGEVLGARASRRDG